MRKKILALCFSLILIFSMPVLAFGFGSSAGSSFGSNSNFGSSSTMGSSSGSSFGSGMSSGMNGGSGSFTGMGSNSNMSSGIEGTTISNDSFNNNSMDSPGSATNIKNGWGFSKGVSSSVQPNNHNSINQQKQNSGSISNSFGFGKNMGSNPTPNTQETNIGFAPEHPPEEFKGNTPDDAFGMSWGGQATNSDTTMGISETADNYGSGISWGKGYHDFNSEGVGISHQNSTESNSFNFGSSFGENFGW